MIIYTKKIFNFAVRSFLRAELSENIFLVAFVTYECGHVWYVLDVGKYKIRTLSHGIT